MEEARRDAGMSETIRVSLNHENTAFRGVLVFDGERFQTLGFAENISRTLPVELINEVSLSLDKGILKIPMLEVLSNPAKGESYGIQMPLDPSDDEVPALQQLVDTMQAAIDERGPR
jgi:hypothetical protein